MTVKRVVDVVVQGERCATEVAVILVTNPAVINGARAVAETSLDEQTSTLIALEAHALW